MNTLYRDVRGNGMSTPELDRIKNEFEADVRRQFSFKVIMNIFIALSFLIFFYLIQPTTVSF